MKYLMYIEKVAYGWDEDGYDYNLLSSPPRYGEYKTVVIEEVQEGELKDLFGQYGTVEGLQTVNLARKRMVGSNPTLLTSSYSLMVKRTFGRGQL